MDSDVADRLGTALGGEVRAAARLPGGASRVTTMFELETPSGGVRSLVLQQVRGSSKGRPAAGVAVEAALLRAARQAGVPVPQVVAAGAADGLDPGWLVLERLEGETIPRRILEDGRYARARGALTEQAARALAAVHSIDPQSIDGLPPTDPLGRPLDVLDALGEARPVLELGARWLALHEPARRGSSVVHGDFRMGNLLVDDAGLRGVLDWELAHCGDPAEDVGWLCSRSWRFGGPGRVGGFGELGEFLANYAAAGGGRLEVERIRWWETFAALKWAVICLLQAATHLAGSFRSVELAAIGRRVCESEWDLLSLMDVTMPALPGVGAPEEAPASSGPFARPSAADLLEAVGEYLETEVEGSREGRARFEARVARNVVAMVGRELVLGPVARAAHAARLQTLGARDDAALAAAIRTGACDEDLVEVGALLAQGTLDELLVANPAYLEERPIPAPGGGSGSPGSTVLDGHGDPGHSGLR